MPPTLSTFFACDVRCWLRAGCLQIAFSDQPREQQVSLQPLPDFAPSASDLLHPQPLRAHSCFLPLQAIRRHVSMESREDRSMDMFVNEYLNSAPHLQHTRYVRPCIVNTRLRFRW